jgi:hypothetical protein
MRRIALSFLILSPWLGVACGNGDDNGSPVPTIPADATTDSKSDVASADAPVADQVVADAPAATDATGEAGDAGLAEDGEHEDAKADAGSMADADSGE